MLEGGADGVGGHRLKPEALDRLLDLCHLDEVAENEFALAPGVAGVDDAVHVGAFHQPLEELEAGLGLAVGGGQLEFLGHHREVFNLPLAAFLQALGHAEFQKMAYGGSDDHFVVLVEVAFLFEFSQGPGNVASDARFFCDDQFFTHGKSGI